MEYEDKQTGERYNIAYSQELQKKDLELQKKRILQRWITIGLLAIMVIFFALILLSGVFSQVGREIFCGG